MAISSSLGIVLGVVPLLQSGPTQVSAFVLPTSSFSKRPSVVGFSWSKTSLAYGPRGDSDEEKDFATSSSPLSANTFQEQLNDELDPACSIEDEDCIAFSSLDDQPLVFNSNANANEDPLCDPRDVDCQAFLPKTYLNSDTYLAAELATRSNFIEKERVDHNWQTAHCPTTFVSVSNSDWVRRVHMETYPLAVCGGARGGVYLVDLEENNVIAKVEGAHVVQVEQGKPNPNRVNTGAAMAKQAMDKLYGKLDGGGVVAVAIHGDLIATSGREGGVRFWRIQKFTNNNLPPIKSKESIAEKMKDPFGRKNGSLSKLAGKTIKVEPEVQSSEFKNMGSAMEGKLIPLGSVPGLQNTIVTSLKFDSNDMLWTACYDGTVDAFNVSGYDDSAVQFPPRKPIFSTDFTGKTHTHAL